MAEPFDELILRQERTLFAELAAFEDECIKRLQSTCRPQLIWQTTPQPRPPIIEQIARVRAEG